MHDRSKNKEALDRLSSVLLSFTRKILSMDGISAGILSLNSSMANQSSYYLCYKANRVM